MDANLSGLLAGLLIAAGVGVYGIMRQRRLEADLQREVQLRHQAELRHRESEQRFRRLLEASPYPTLICNLEDGKLRHINPDLRRRLEFQGGELGGNVRQFFVDPGAFDAAMQRLLQGEDLVKCELRLHNPDGEPITVAVHALRIEYDKTPAAFLALNDLSEVAQLRGQLETLTNIDPLTGLTNRRHFLMHLEHEIERARRLGESLSLLALDIDDFKNINTCHGHAAGDEVLLTLAQALKSMLRSYDFAGRLGSGEFMVGLPETHLADAVRVAERIRQTMEQTVVLHGEQSIAATLSVGVVELQPEEALTHLMRRAAEQLDQARRAGGNRVSQALDELGAATA